MIRNVGLIDRIIRLSFGIIALFFVVTGRVTGVMLVLSIIGGTIGFFTGIYGACPLYRALKINTCKVRN